MHLTAVADPAGSGGGPVPRTPRDVEPSRLDADHPALALAREHIGLLYLWGGLTPLGLDCSGLVHHTWRRFGIVVPATLMPRPSTPRRVPPHRRRRARRPYFFARPGRRIHHVGIVVRPGRMVHASETGGVLVEEALTTDRVDTLVAAGRLPARDGRPHAPLLVLAGVVSVQFGGAFAATLVPKIGAAGSVTLRLLFATVILYAVARPRGAAARGRRGSLSFSSAWRSPP